MRRILIRVFSLVIALLVCLSACAPAQDDAASKGIAPADPASAKGEVVEVTMLQLKVEIAEQLQKFADYYNSVTEGVHVTVETVGGGEDWGVNMTAKVGANQAPVIFNIEGDADYARWQDYIADQTGEEWTKYTDLAYTRNGKAYGFPVAIEGYGLGYNVALLEKAGIDPATLTTYSALEEAFKKIDGMKEELGIESVTCFGASLSGGMWGFCGVHHFSIYLGAGMEADDRTLVEKFNSGEVDEARLTDYARFVKLMADYSDQELLTTGNYDDQLAHFASGKSVFINQGNWADPSLKSLGVTFDYDYISTPINDAQEYTGLYLFAPSWYCVNAQATEEQQRAARDFLNFMVTSEAGHDYMVNKAGLIPAYNNVTLAPTGNFSKAVMAASASGDYYPFLGTSLKSGVAQDLLMPAYDMFAQDTSGDALNNFVQDVKAVAEQSAQQ